MSEEPDPDALTELCRNPVEGHAVNAYWMVDDGQLPDGDQLLLQPWGR